MECLLSSLQLSKPQPPTPCMVIFIGMVTVRYVDYVDVFWGRLNKISDDAGAQFNVPCCTLVYGIVTMWNNNLIKLKHTALCALLKLSGEWL